MCKYIYECVCICTALLFIFVCFHVRENLGDSQFCRQDHTNNQSSEIKWLFKNFYPVKLIMQRLPLIKGRKTYSKSYIN